MATSRSARPADLQQGFRGATLLHNPALNKGTAFTEDERTALGLHGLLPPHVESLDEQVVRAYEAYQRKTDDLERHIYLRALQDTNEVLFYSLVLSHTEEMTPIIYTPVVGQACQQFCHIYRRPRGLVISYPLRDAIPSLLRNRPNDEVDVIVVTDGERILGIGDQGMGGLGIPIGKLSLYTAIGGVDPSRTLPIALDVGTNNPERLSDPEYLGWRHHRVAGAEYGEFVDRFVQAVKQELPNTCLQWEDFSTSHARALLDRYADQLLTFNDDIQGTASVVLATIISAAAATGQRLRDQQVVIFGAGSAIGVADYLCTAMMEEGLSEADARGRFWIINRGGLLHDARRDLSPERQRYAQPAGRVADWPRTSAGIIGLSEVIGKLRATILIGLSTVAGAFSESIVREMARKVDRPIILPLSNPTDKTEATPDDLMRWTNGRALIGTGSPFPPVEYGGHSIRIAQCNNSFIFPAVGLGLVAAGARRATDAMLVAAARALAEQCPTAKDPAGCLLPTMGDAREVSLEIAVAVGREAQRAGLAPQTTEEALRAKVLATRWTPAYT